MEDVEMGSVEVEEESEEEEPSRIDLKQRTSPIYKHFSSCDDNSKLKCDYCVKTLVVSETSQILSLGVDFKYF
jgi:hypothetical protein